MRELSCPRIFLFSTLTLAATLATGTAQAEPPTTPVAPAVTETVAPAAPPPAYRAPLAYATPENPLDVEYPPEMRSRSTGMVAGGVLLLSFGLVGVIAGSAMVGAHEPVNDSDDEIIPGPCFECGNNGFDELGSERKIVYKPGVQTAGIATLVGSAVAIGVGIPLLVIGSKKVPVTDEGTARAAKLTPTLRVGSTSATLTWQF